MERTGTYIYGVGKVIPSGSLHGLRGVAGAEVRTLEHRGLAAAVSDVDLDEFGAEGLRRNLENLDWVANVAWAHDEVVKAVAARAAVAPLRMVIVCLGDDSVRAKLDEMYDDIQAILSRIEHRVEWGVKAFLDDGPRRADRTQVESGAAYLRRRSTELESHGTTETAAAEVADGLHAALDVEAFASRRHPPQDKTLSRHRGRMILNGSYLAGTGEGGAWEDRIEYLRQQHPDVRLRLTGPWPPYSFAELD
ncbi:MAG: gas vesicle protein GvpFL [Streptosporangiales bacterium]|nr:gas vesicle protein GvpFL [Streptosporangiales bacterium]